MEIITSKANKLVKKAKKYHQKKYRTDAYLIEGWHLFEEAELAGVTFHQIFVISDYAERVAHYPQAVEVTEEIMKDLADSPSPQGIVAVVALEPSILPDQLEGRFLILEDVQDPGNVGTLVRTADAAGFTGVFLSEKSADIYNIKTLRSMQGSHFHLPIYRISMEELIRRLKQSQVSLLASTLAPGSQAYDRVVAPANFALVMGNEGQGISQTTAEAADTRIHIPMPGQAESLNVAVAGGILIFSLI